MNIEDQFYHEWFSEHRGNIYYLPLIEHNLSEKFRYKYGNELAICIPCYGREVYGRAAVWNALSLLYASDVIKCGVPIYIFVGERDAKIHEKILDKAGFPKEMRVICPQTEKDGFVTKWTGIFDKELANYERLIVLDADAITVKYGENMTICEDICNNWDYKTFDVCVPCGENAESRPADFLLEKTDEMHGVNTFWQRIETVAHMFGKQNPREFMQNPNAKKLCIGGWFVGFSQMLLKSVEFKNVFNMLRDVSWGETPILEVWLLVADSKVMQYDFPFVWIYENLNKSSFTHFYTTNGFEWKERWKSDLTEAYLWATEDRGQKLRWQQ